MPPCRPLIVMPVKSPAGAKSRLSAVLSREQRSALALQLFEINVKFLSDSFGQYDRLVVTNDEAIAAVARTSGALTLRDEGDGETRAVEAAAKWAADHGYPAQLVLPGDMAGLDRDELQNLLDAFRETPSLILSPATDDDGTNAVLMSPPDAIPYRFGDRSFERYQQRADKYGIPCAILRLRSLVLDVDTPEDLNRFLESEPDHPATKMVNQWLTIRA